MEIKEILVKLDRIIELLSRPVRPGIENNSCDLTVAEWCGEWVATYKALVWSPSSAYKNNGIIKNYIKPMFGDIRLVNLDSHDIQKKINTISFERQKEHVYSLFKSMLEKAVSLGYIGKNPLNTIELKKHDKRSSDALTKGQEVIFVRNSQSDLYCDAFMIMLYAGLRRGEALALTEKDIDLIRRVIIVNKSLWRQEVGKPKTKSSVRVVPISDELYEYVRKYSGNSSERIFNICDAVLYKHFDRIRRRCSFKNINFTNHSLRHTFITRCAEKGINIKVVQKWVGHSDSKITSDIYTHINQDFEAAQVKVLNEKSKRK